MDPKERFRFTKEPPVPIEPSPEHRLLNLIANLDPEQLRDAALGSGLFSEGEDERSLLPARLLTRARQNKKLGEFWDAAAGFKAPPPSNPFVV
jgi:hypothetical protein